MKGYYLPLRTLLLRDINFNFFIRSSGYLLQPSGFGLLDQPAFELIKKLQVIRKTKKYLKKIPVVLVLSETCYRKR